jgi:large conductance mechanosensitive channel
MKGFVKEFKAFAVKGNVIDLAVAVVIGAAFGKIVTSLVENIITPLTGLMMDGIDFSGLSYSIDGVIVSYGVFLQSILNFFIIALFVFIIIKGVNRAKDTILGEEEKVAKSNEPSEEVRILSEIRDILKR